jgi:hypothetical protein
VGVILTHDLADHAGALVEGAVRPVSAVVHRVDDATVNRFEAISHVRKRTADDHGHRVIEVRPLHLGLEVHVLDSVGTRAGRDVAAHDLALDGGALLRILIRTVVFGAHVSLCSVLLKVFSPSVSIYASCSIFGIG